MKTVYDVMKKLDDIECEKNMLLEINAGGDYRFDELYALLDEYKELLLDARISMR